MNKVLEKSPVKVLVIEDHEIAQKVMGILLNNIGCSLDVAETGAKAIEYFQKNTYDLVVADIGLPDINGLDVCEKIKQFEKPEHETPIVVLSAYSDENYKKRAKLLKLNDYIEKPITEERCQAILEEFIPNFKNRVPNLKSIKKEFKMQTFPKEKGQHNAILRPINISKVMKIENFEVCYSNYAAAKQMYEEIFIKKIYDFSTNKQRPFIIDAGSNIGLSTLFFKSKYPDACILCFEPDPIAFELLEKNVIINKLKDVQIFNAALSNKADLIPFYGEIYGMETDQRGNSTIQSWGSQRETCAEIKVNAVCLSSYINQEVDLLKMDIEGSEQIVLEELEGKLSFIKEIRMEIHELRKKYINNRLDKICHILEKNHFKLKVKPQNQITINILPSQISNWIKETDPEFTLVEAKRP